MALWLAASPATDRPSLSPHRPEGRAPEPPAFDPALPAGMAAGDEGSRALEICIVAHFAWGALAGDARRHIGGVERQVSQLARWLAGRGHRVTVLTWDEGQGDGTDVEGVRVLTLCRRADGVPGFRFFHPRWTSLVRALARADADVYYQNCGEYVTGQVALWCRRHGRAFVYSVAADADCDASLPLMRTRRERLLYRFGVRRADRIIVQTRTQQRMLREGFGRDSEWIPMPCIAPGDPEIQPAGPGARRVLWIGRIAPEKRPDRLLALAAACPDLAFDLVGPEDGSEYARQTIAQARAMPNVFVHGPAGRERVSAFYRSASALCCTSEGEGFPNIFLEAWSHGVPVVSTVDPDGVITDLGLGVAAGEMSGLARGLQALLANTESWWAVSARARTYYLDHHTMDGVMPLYERVFREAEAGAARRVERQGRARRPGLQRDAR
jgi:glycosyltransferase involved in cell wall biosynthesis